MPMGPLSKMGIEKFFASSAREKLQEAAETVAALQHAASSLAEESNDRLTLVKMGTVFQIFLIDTLASGKKLGEFTEEDWKAIGQKVLQHAIIDEGQKYSEFVFSMYAQFIELSAEGLPAAVTEERREGIRSLAEEIRTNLDQMNKGEITETACIEGCLWLSLEAMLKLLCASLTALTGPELSRLAEAVTQLAFEYGRLVLFSREQTLLTEYLENQRLLDERLQSEYEAFLLEIQERADRFLALVDAAFSSDIHNMLAHSVTLAREAGVKDHEILTTLDEIDDFFMT